MNPLTSTDSPSQIEHARPHCPRLWNSWCSAAFISAVGIPLLWLIWGRTGEILQDFGSDLYFAWQINQGRVLYRDMECLYGPLSPYFNAAVTGIFGPTFRTFLIANLAILILTILALYRLLRLVAGPFVASIAIAFFLCVFALTAPTRITNYNFLAPYAHQITHGFLLCLAVLLCIDLYYRRRSRIAAAAGGFLTGLAFLTKPEIFLGCAAAFAIGLTAALWLRRFETAATTLLIAFAASLSAPLISLFYLAAKMPFNTARNGIFGGWQYVDQPSVLSSPFYQGSLGIDHAWENALLMFQYAGLYALIAALLATIGIAVPKKLPKSRYAIPSAGLLAALSFFCLVNSAGDRFASFWIDSARGLPLLVAFALVLSFRALLKSRASPAESRRSLIQFLLAVLAMFFLAKIVLSARLYQFGFVLAVPGAMLSIVALLRWLPDWIDRRGGSGAIVRFGAIGILLAFAFQYVAMTRRNLAERTLPIPLPGGQIAWTRPDQADLVSAIKYLVHYPNATLAVLPDAVGINYAAALPNPVPYVVLHPIAMKWYGEQNVIEAFNANPPNFVLIVVDSDDAFGAHRFGVDFGQHLSAWIAKNYKPVATFSATDRPAELLMAR